MLNRIFYSLGIRMVMALTFMGVAGIASLGSHAKDSDGASGSNPWSKDYKPSSSSSSSSAYASSGTSTPKYRWVDKRTGLPATQDQIEDEAYRRQMLHEARESYERDHGPVDTTSMDKDD